jgi:hypothetical protein
MEAQPKTKFLIAGDMLQHVSPVTPVHIRSALFMALCSYQRVELNMNHRLLDVPENRPVAAAIEAMRKKIRADEEGLGGVDLSFIKEDEHTPTLHLCYTNHEVAHLNESMMLFHLHHETDGVPYVEKHASNSRGQGMYVYEGLKVMVRRSEKKIGLWNKAQFDVVRVDAVRQEVTLKWVYGKRPYPVEKRIGAKRKRADDDGDDDDSDAGGVQEEAHVSERRVARLAPKLAQAYAMRVAAHEVEIERVQREKPNNNWRRTVKTIQHAIEKLQQLLANDKVARQQDSANRLLSVGGGPVAVDDVTVSFELLSAHMAPRYAMTSYAIQGRTLRQAEFERVMLHGLDSIDLRTLHVLVGRVTHHSQLVRPGLVQKVVCRDPTCEHRTQMGVVYCITQAGSGRAYVGQTLHKNPKQRFAEHMGGSVNKALREEVQAAVARGDVLEDVFLWTVLGKYEVSLSPTGVENRELKFFENEWMAKLLAKGVTLFNERVDAADVDVF